MDTATFKKKMKPSRKRSRLEPFRAQILELKTDGYADWQIGEWLAENGVSVTRQAVQQFVSKHMGTYVPSPPPPQQPAPAAPRRTNKKQKPTTKPSAQKEFDFA